MQSKALTVDDYLASLPEDRRAAITAVRNVILKNLDGDYEEGMLYGMIGYFVPHRVYPAGYHCDPAKPLAVACLGSQKNYMSLHLMPVYYGCEEDDAASKHAKWFRKAWAGTGKKLDMGKACIRFKKAEDLALDVIGEAFKRVPAKAYIRYVEGALATSKQKTAPAKTAKKKTAPAGKAHRRQN